MGSKGHASAQKVARGSIRRQKRNKAATSQVKTEIATAEKLIAAGNKDEAKKAAAIAEGALRKSANKHKIHPNNAARRTSRLMKKLNKGAAAPKVKAAEKAA